MGCDFLRFNAFNLIVDKLDEALAPKEFVRDAEDKAEPEGTAVIYRSEETLYSVLYNRKSKRFELRMAAAGDEEPEWKNLSIWLFDPENDPMSEAESIANDFVETTQGPKRAAAVQPARKKKKSEDSNSDPIFFFNRLVNIFPELRDEMNQEKIEYGNIRPFTFAKNQVVPKIRGMAKTYGDTDVFKKLCELLSDMYRAGDLDTRAVITNVIINSLDAAEAEKAMQFFDDNLKTAAAAERKLIGKKIKPEKKPKPKKITAASLNDMKKY